MSRSLSINSAISVSKSDFLDLSLACSIKGSHLPNSEIVNAGLFLTIQSEQGVLMKSDSPVLVVPDWGVLTESEWGVLEKSDCPVLITPEYSASVYLVGEDSLSGIRYALLFADRHAKGKETYLFWRGYRSSSWPSLNWIFHRVIFIVNLVYNSFHLQFLKSSNGFPVLCLIPFA